MKRTFAAFAMFLALSGLAAAGGRADRETEVDLTALRAMGSVYDTRVSADADQYIGCLLSATSGGAPSLTCMARDAALEKLSCSSTSASLVTVAQAINDTSFISFTCDATGALTALVVNKGSMWLP